MMDPDIENSVKRIVGEEIRKSQNNLLSQMEGMFSIKLQEFDHQQKERSELQMNRLQNELSVNTNHLTDKSLKDVMNDDSICLLKRERIEQVSSQLTVTSSLITPVETNKSSKPESTITNDGAVVSTSKSKGPGENKMGKAPLKRKSCTDLQSKTPSKTSKHSKRKQELADFSHTRKSMFTELTSNLMAAFTSSHVQGEQNINIPSTSADNISNSTEPVQMIFSDNDDPNESDNSEGIAQHNLGDIEFELPNIIRDSERYGEEDEASVSNIVETVIRKKADVASLVKKENHKIPSNCKGLNPPAVYTEIWQNLDRKARLQDLMFQTVQRLMGLGIVPILRIAQMLKTKSFDQTNCRELVSRAIAILCNAFFEMSVSRHMLLIRPAFDRSFNQLINRSEPVGENNLFSGMTFLNV
ncbi:unnamed protein product [Mytilus coruscus]|uniref:Uncharacterized protein n=1 Tax=Mytilus coruscus TaxID=42192 RepID=A0A6J8BJW1_MYTCO|nr:unnamed protein product [Mytilus coruscus]